MFGWVFGVGGGMARGRGGAVTEYAVLQCVVERNKVSSRLM